MGLLDHHPWRPLSRGHSLGSSPSSLTPGWVGRRADPLPHKVGFRDTVGWASLWGWGQGKRPSQDPKPEAVTKACLPISCQGLVCNEDYSLSALWHSSDKRSQNATKSWSRLSWGGGGLCESFGESRSLKNDSLQ